MGALAFLPQIFAVIQQVPGLVSIIEGLIPGHGKGEAKKSAVKGLVLVGIQAIEGLEHKDLVNDQQFADGLSQVIDGSMLVLNSINKKPVA